jgi:tRNA pseudouridine13 synthase
LRVPGLERILGIEVYSTRSAGIDGVIRRGVEDFVVEEALVDGSKALVFGSGGDVGRMVLGSSLSGGRYLLCVLVKQNWDTFIVLARIARQLGLRSGQVQIAGIKDARAVTAQYVTLEGVSVEAARKFDLKDVELRPIGFLRMALSTYYLLGNGFRVAIRGVRRSKAVVEERVRKTMHEVGLMGGAPNFFGHQRFGTVRPITHLVGKEVVHGNIRKAVILFLAKPSVYEHPMSRLVRQGLRDTLDFKRALADFPEQLRYERMLLKRLAEDSSDFEAAFRVLPARLRLLFVEAFQSYLFNRFLSGRIHRGLSLGVAEVGDFVVSVERSGLPMSGLFKVVSLENFAEVNRAISVGKMQVAVPLVGYGRGVSQGVQGDIERKILEEEGVVPGDFRVGSLPDLSSKGGLRAVVAPVRDFSFSVGENEGAKGSGRQVSVGFSLYRGAYATVILREIMKSRRPVEAGF